MPIQTNTNAESLGDTLRLMREGAGLSHRELGRRVNVSHSHLIRCEKGERKPSPRLMDDIARVFASIMNGVDE